MNTAAIAPSPLLAIFFIVALPRHPLMDTERESKWGTCDLLGPEERGGVEARRSAEEGEFRHRRRAAAERPEDRTVSRPRGRALAHVVFTVGLERRGAEERQPHHAR